jgi:hypothetical protein
MTTKTSKTTKKKPSRAGGTQQTITEHTNRCHIYSRTKSYSVEMEVVIQSFLNLQTLLGEKHIALH